MKIGKIFKIFFAACVILVIGFVGVRYYMIRDNSVLTELYPTDAAKAEFRRGEDGFLTHDFSDEISKDGYFSAFGFVYLSGEHEIQLTGKYNDSLLSTYFKDDSEEDFTWELRDENGKTLSYGEIVSREEKYQYNFFRIVFDGVEIGKDSELYLALVNKVENYPADGAKVFCVHTPNQELERYELTENEKISMK